VNAGPRTAEKLELLLRETQHRCSNDLQLVVSLLSLQASRCLLEEARLVLRQTADRVSILARARSALLHEVDVPLEATLQRVCSALESQAEPRAITIVLHCHDGCSGLEHEAVTVIALAVNELATNAIKHAFKTGQAGRITIDAAENERQLIVIVDDDGLPFAEDPSGTGLGMDLIRRLIGSLDGVLIAPEANTKRFEMRIPKTGCARAIAGEPA